MKTLLNRSKRPITKPTKWLLIEVEPDSDLEVFLTDLLENNDEPGVISSAAHQGGTLSDALFTFAKAGNATPWLHLRIVDYHGTGAMMAE